MRVTLFGRASVAQKMKQFENVIKLLVEAGHDVLLNDSLYAIQGRLHRRFRGGRDRGRRGEIRRTR